MKSLSKVFAIIALLATVVSSADAQTEGGVGIGTRTPNSSSMLEVYATDKGVLLPRVALTGIADITTINSPVNSMIVYNSTITNLAMPAGYYYWNANAAPARWTRLIVDGDITNGLEVKDGKVMLGGALTAATTITTDATKTLSIKGLISGTTADKLMVVTDDGVVKIINATADNTAGTLVARDVNGSFKAQDITAQGNVAVNAGNLTVGSTTKVGAITLHDAAAGTNAIGIKAPNAVTPYILTLPDAQAAAGQVLTSKDENGTLIWTSVAPVEVGDANNTLRWNGVTKTWAKSSVLTNDGANIAISGKLAVGGTTTLNDSLTVKSHLAVTGTTVLVDSLLANKTLNVAGITKLGNKLAVAGTTALNDSVTINKHLLVTGTTALSDSLVANKTLDVAGITKLGSKLAVGGTTALNDSVTINKHLLVTGTTVLNDSVTLASGKKLIFTSDASNSISLVAPSAGVIGYDLTLPAKHATVGQVLTSKDAAGTLIWTSVAPVDTATVDGNTLRWDATNKKWAESSALINDGANIAISGKLAVGGTTTLNDSLTVKSHLAVTGTTVLLDSLLANKTLDVAGITKLGSKLAVGGTTALNDSVTINKHLLVTGTTVLADSLIANKTLDVAGITKLGSKLAVAGTTALNDSVTVNKHLLVTGTTALADSLVANKTLNVAGITKLGSKLAVAGTTALNDSVTINKHLLVTGTTALADSLVANKTLDVAGITKLGNKLAVGGTTALNDSVTINKHLLVTGTTVLNDSVTLASGKKLIFASDASNSISLVAPSTGVIGYDLTLPAKHATVGQVLTSKDAAGTLVWTSVAPVDTATVDGNTLRWDATNKKWAESSALTNDGANIAISGKLAVAGTTALNDSVTINKHLLVTGTTALADSLIANKTLDVVGITKLGSKLSVGGTTALNDSVTINKHLLVAGTTALADSLVANKTLNVAGITKLGNKLSVGGTTALNDSVTINKHLLVTGTTALADSLVANKTLDVAGITKLGNKLSVGGTTALNDSVTINKHLLVTGTTALADSLVANKTLDVAGITKLGNKLAVGGTTALNDSVTINKHLLVTGTTVLNDSVTLASGKKLIFASDASNSISLVAPSTGVIGYDLTLPAKHATVGQVLTSKDAAGTLVWTSVAPVDTATVDGNTLRWDATNKKWAESSALNNDGANIAISGKLAVAGTTALNDSVTVNKHLLVTGTTALADSLVANKTLNVAGITKLGSKLAVGGTTALNDSVTINKHLLVAGTTALADSLIANKTLDVAGITKLGSKLAVGGTTALNDSVTINKHLLVTGTTALSDSLIANKTLDVAGITKLGSKLAVGGTTTLNDSLTVKSHLAVTGTTALADSLVANKTLNVAGITKLGSKLAVGGTTALNDSVTINKHLLVTGTTVLNDSVTLASGKKLIFTSDASNSISLVAPSTGVTGYDLTLPAKQATIGQVLTSSDAAGTLTWATPSAAFNDIKAATAANTPIDNTNFAQGWDWSTATTENPLTITTNALTTGSALTINANALTTGSALSVSSTSAVNEGTNGLLYVANKTATTTGTIARLEANTTAGAGLTVLANGNVGVGTATPVATFHNAGSTILGLTTASNLSAFEALTADKVNNYSGVVITQTDNDTYSALPTLTAASEGQIYTVVNSASSTNIVSMEGFPIARGSSATFMYDGTQWITPYSLISAVNGTNLFSSAIGGGFGVDWTRNSIFLGVSAGRGAALASSSNFLGEYAGYDATRASNSNFFGTFAGGSATKATYSNFLGYHAGYGATEATKSNFMGLYAGSYAKDASYSTLLGYKVANENESGPDHIGTNNIIIGTNITLPNATKNSINIGGVLFGTGTNADSTATTPVSAAVTGGKIGIGVVAPAAVLHLAAGTAEAGTAPLKLTEGVKLTTAEKGALEYDGTHLYFTPVGTRYQLDQQSISVGAPINATDNNGATIGSGFLSLELADATHPGIVSAGAQIFAGPKTFTDNISLYAGKTLNLVGSSNGLATVSLSAPSVVKNAYTLTLPDDKPAVGQVLSSNDAAGTLQWATLSSSLSGLTDATVDHSIDNKNYAQTWNWSTATTQNPLSITADALTTGSALSISSVSTGLTTGGLLTLTGKVAAATAKGLLNVVNNAASTSGTVATIQANTTAGAGLTVLANGNVGVGTATPAATFHNAGPTILGMLKKDNPTATPYAPAAKDLVDIYSGLIVNQTVNIGTVRLPAPTNDTAGRIFTIANSSGSLFPVYDNVCYNVINPGQLVSYVWDGAKWTASSTINSIVKTTVNYTVKLTDETILAQPALNGTITITLPNAWAGNAGQRYTVKNITATPAANSADVPGVVKVITTGAQIEDNTYNVGVSGSLPYQGWTFQSDGTTWWIVARI